ncbi:hypothetical protein CONLIGDRAFT_225238 [Coniochaeta ligniaria NRRL 30616]|uniref:Uncharacterized protein n=1 Tax=Coniochaeta ligniaria NRRL 30616 TaxID=1408157 RepID=A0A1J7J480_9PEZI|nr:hypothetical protein CONLIGDRAFT_225238 [Coniochaeta ligniaria NRRL 30616]
MQHAIVQQTRPRWRTSPPISRQALQAKVTSQRAEIQPYTPGRPRFNLAIIRCLDESVTSLQPGVGMDDGGRWFLKALRKSRLRDLTPNPSPLTGRSSSSSPSLALSASTPCLPHLWETMSPRILSAAMVRLLALVTLGLQNRTIFAVIIRVANNCLNKSCSHVEFGRPLHEYTTGVPSSRSFVSPHDWVRMP